MGGSKARTLIIAGSALALEIAVDNNIVESASVTFPDSRNIVLRHAERADKILLHDLQLRPSESPLTKSLDRFAANLERLTILDRLSVEPGLNLYEAVAGIYETLDRLYHWDMQRLRDDPANSGKSEDILAMTVQCARHGHPAMHERGNLGLAVDYWQSMRLVRPLRRLPPDAETTSEAADDEDPSVPTTWAILVSCAPIGGSLVYQPVRVSDKWLSDAIEKADVGMGGVGGADVDLDWLEPQNTILPSSQGDDGKTDDAGNLAAPTTLASAKLPDVRFNAVFEPPVAIPLAVWHQINELVGHVPETEPLLTFDALSFPVLPGTQHDPSEPRAISYDKDVSFYPKGGLSSDEEQAAEMPVKKHRHTLFIYKPVYGRVLSQLPFSHPSQLIRLLPTLRQYAFLATLLETGFGAKRPDAAELRPAAASAAATTRTTTKTTALGLNGSKTKTSVQPTLEDAFEKFANERRRGAGDDYSAAADRMDMDVVLTAHAAPRLQVVFPFRAGTAEVVLEIGPNAQVHVVSQNVVEEEEDGEGSGGTAQRYGGKGKGKGRRLYPQDLGRMLEVCEDLGIWSEWIRSRCG